MPGGTFEILAVLAAGGAESGEILDRMRSLDPGAEPSLATFYRRLKGAIDRGWIEVADAGAEAEGPGRPARPLRITPSGLDAARSEAVRRKRFSSLLSSVGGESP